MQNEFVPDDLCQVWQSQGPVPAPPPPEELRRQAGTISEEDYAREKANFEKLLRNLVQG